MPNMYLNLIRYNNRRGAPERKVHHVVVLADRPLDYYQDVLVAAAGSSTSGWTLEITRTPDMNDADHRTVQKVLTEANTCVPYLVLRSGRHHRRRSVGA